MRVNRAFVRLCRCMVLCLCLFAVGCSRSGAVSDTSHADTATTGATQHSTASTLNPTTSTTAKPTPERTGTTATSPTAATSSKTGTTTTASVSAVPLYFSVTPGGQIGTAPSSQLTTVTVRFPLMSRMVRLSLPADISIKIVDDGYTDYAQLYRKNVRIGRLVPNHIPEDFPTGTVTDRTSYDATEILTRHYTSGDKAAVTYAATVYTEDNFFCILEMAANSIRPEDMAACVREMGSHTLLTRDNHLHLKDKPYLRIAIAGNSFVGTSQVGQQLEAILRQNGKQGDVSIYCYGNYRIAKFVDNPDFMRELRNQRYDVLFLCGVYTADDAMLLPVIEAACEEAGTLPVLFPAHNETDVNVKIAYETTAVKLADWRASILHLLHNNIPEYDLVIYDNVRHSKELAGYAGAVMIYGMLYETAPHAPQVAVNYSGVAHATAQQVEELVMHFIQPYYT